MCVCQDLGLRAWKGVGVSGPWVQAAVPGAEPRLGKADRSGLGFRV